MLSGVCMLRDSRSFEKGRSVGGCTFSVATPGFLAGCADDTAADECEPIADFEGALVACAGKESCTGVTKTTDGAFTLRSTGTLLASPAGELSYVCLERSVFSCKARDVRETSARLCGCK